MIAPLRVGLRWPGAPGRRGGVDVYAEGLARAFIAHGAGETELTALVGAGTLPPTIEGLRVAALPTPASRSAWSRRMETLRRALPGARGLLAPAIDALGLDVVHYPATRMDDPGLRTPSVLTFFDMQEEFLPGHFGWRERMARRIVHRDGVRSAAMVIAPSRFTADALRDRYGAPGGKIRVIPAGIDAIFRPEPEPGERERLAAGYALPDDYLLYPANPWPHKNHARLFAALAAAGPLPALVCTGRLEGETQSARGMAQAAGLPEGAVRDLGFVPPEDLAALYRGARGLIFPSLFEGFGLPVLEAMACGCPVACSSMPAVAEAVGDAARLFEPDDTGAIARALHWLSADGPERDAARERGLARVVAFRWPRIVPEVIATYRDAARAAGRGVR